MLNRTMYVFQLTEQDKNKLKKYLMSVPCMTVEGLNNMMDGRICDMEEVVTFDELKRILNNS